MPPKSKSAKKKAAPLALAYSIVDPLDYLRETIHVPGCIFGPEFASTEATKKKMFPVLVVSWDRNATCPDHRGADLHGVVTVQDLTGYTQNVTDPDLTFDTFELKLNYFCQMVGEEKKRKDETKRLADQAAFLAAKGSGGSKELPVDKKTSRIHEYFTELPAVDGKKYVKCVPAWRRWRRRQGCPRHTSRHVV